MALRDRRFPELALFVLAAIIHTWPLAAAPGWWTRTDNADTALNAWAIAWVGTAIVRSPADLFNANIFYPEPRTLAFSEITLPQALLGAPLTWAGADPVLVYNLLAIAGFALSGFAMASFPSSDSVQSLRAIGVTHVLAHKRRVPPDLLERCTHAADLTLVADEGDQVLYALTPGDR